MSASKLLRAARRSAAASQRELAKVSGVSQPAIAAIESGAHDTSVRRLEQLLASLGQRVIVLPTRSRTVAEAAEAIHAGLARRDEEWAWREIVQTSDDLAHAEPDVRVVLAISRPHSVGDRNYDALLAATVDYWLTIDQLPRPRWLDDAAYVLDEPWDVEELPALRARARQETPEAFRRHGVYLAPAQLSSV